MILLLRRAAPSATLLRSLAPLAALALLAPASLAAQSRCTPLAGTLLEGAVSAQSLFAPPLEQPVFLIGGGEIAGFRTCLEAPRARTDAAVSAIAVLPLRVTGVYRSTYAFERNDGALWSGRGLGTALSGGAVVHVGPLSVTADPTFAYHQNRPYAIVSSTMPGSPYRYPYWHLDWPQRFGADAFEALDGGQTSVALTASGVSLSAGTDNLWWGPADRYPLLLSSTAPGFRHVRLGTARPRSIGIGTVEANLVWGRLDESPYFDSDPSNDHHALTLLTVGFRPSFAPGLGVGGALLEHHAPGEPFATAIRPFSLKAGGTSPSNAIASLVGEWRLADTGTRFYGEWAREDYWLNTEDLLTEIDHSEAYLIGFEKLVVRGGTTWRWRGEATHVKRADAQSLRGLAVFYEHTVITQGHTHRGQLLGAAIGPGSNAQFLAVDATGRRMLGGYVERIRRDDDAYGERFAHVYGFRGHDLELTLGAYGIERVGKVGLDWDLSASRRKNRNFLGLDGVSWSFRRESNVALSVHATWLKGH